MAKTISELRNQSIQVRDASAAGENTATRVGTVLNDIVGHIEDYENTQSSNNSSQDAKIDSVKTSLNTEIARAKTEESNLSNQIGTERTERQAAVSSEETARIQADNAEKTARMAADNAEQDARIQADNTEKTARENADITLRTMIQTEISNRQIAVKQEEIRAKAEEERLQGEIDNTNTNVETLEDKVNSNHDHLTDEVARLDLTDNEIKADLEAETARAKAAEEALATAIADEKAAIMGTDRIADGAITIEKVADSAIDDEPTAGSDNLIKSGGVANKLAELDQEIDDMIDYTEKDFAISDNQGNDIVQFKNGHIRTKNFDSQNSATKGDVNRVTASIFADGDFSSDLDISDENNNTIAQFKNGHIRTKNFDSRESVLKYEFINNIDFPLNRNIVILSDGTVSGGGGVWSCSDEVVVKTGDSIEYAVETKKDACFIAAYTNGIFNPLKSLSSKSTSYEALEGTYHVPENVDKVVVCTHKNYLIDGHITLHQYAVPVLTDISEHNESLVRLSDNKDNIIKGTSLALDIDKALNRGSSRNHLHETLEGDIKMASTVRTIVNEYPNAKIFMLGVTYIMSGEQNGNIRLFQEEINAMCDYFGMDAIEMHKIGAHEDVDNLHYTVDGVHFYTDEGSMLVYNYIMGHVLMHYNCSEDALRGKKILILGDSTCETVQGAKGKQPDPIIREKITNTWVERLISKFAPNVYPYAVGGSGWNKKDGYDVIDRFNMAKEEDVQYDIIIISSTGWNDYRFQSFGFNYTDMMNYLTDNNI